MGEFKIIDEVNELKDDLRALSDVAPAGRDGCKDVKGQVTDLPDANFLVGLKPILQVESRILWVGGQKW